MSTSDAQAILSTRGLTKDYPGMRALDAFDIDVRAGEIHGIVGANGAGKSTLIKVLSGLIAPTRGKISVEGYEVKIPTPTAAQRLGISVVHQELPLLPNLTAAQNMTVGRETSRLFAPARQGAARRAYRRVARDFPGAPAASHRLESQGLYAWQIVAIMRALATDARVIVLDEPTSSLTVDERAVLHVRVRELATRGLAVLYVSHFLDDILEVASVVSVLRDGRLVHRGPTRGLDEDKLLGYMTSPALTATPSTAPLPPTSERPPSQEVEGLAIKNLRTGRTELPQLTVAQSEIVGLYGLEDSGARDVIEAVFGLTRRTGAISWRGHRLPANPREVIRAGVALVTGDRKRAGIGQWTVEMNHALPRLSRMPLFATKPRRKLRGEAKRSIAEFGVKGAPGQQMAMLSGGNQQKLLLARWVDTAPSMLFLLDEPTHGVDVGGRRAIYDQLRRFAARGNAVLLHSTDPEEIVELCDRAVPFASGRPLPEIRRANLTIDRLEHAVRASERHQHSAQGETGIEVAPV